MATLISHAHTKTGADTGTQVLTGSGELTGIVFDGTGTLTLYDGTGTSDQVIFKSTNAVNTILPSVEFTTGLYRVQTGDSATSIIYINRRV